MPAFPIEYDVELVKNDGERARLAAGNRPEIAVGPPPDFGGGDTWWSPEHLLVSALAACMTETIVAGAHRAELKIGSIKCRARGVLGRVEHTVAFTEMHLAYEISVLADDVTRAEKVVADAKARCFVANSLRCPVDVTARVSGV